jgi:hypothetical protein
MIEMLPGLKGKAISNDLPVQVKKDKESEQRVVQNKLEETKSQQPPLKKREEKQQLKEAIKRDDVVRKPHS